MASPLNGQSQQIILLQVSYESLIPPYSAIQREGKSAESALRPSIATQSPGKSTGLVLKVGRGDFCRNHRDSWSSISCHNFLQTTTKILFAELNLCSMHSVCRHLGKVSRKKVAVLLDFVQMRGGEGCA